MEEQQTYKKLYDKYYKVLLLIPVALMILSLGYIGYFYSQNGDFIYKDISLTGGTSVTLYEQISPSQIKQDLSGNLTDLNTRAIYDIITREQKAIILETKLDGDSTKQVLENYLGYNLTSENSSFEFTGSSLSASFYNQLLVAVLIAFVFMAIVVFIIFRTLAPSAAVIASAFADIVMTLAVANLLGMRMSTAGIVAFLMLIGYSVDTDILLTTRILKRQEGSVNERLFGAFKTGMTMTLTSLFAVSFALVIVMSFSVVLTQIFTILVIGLIFDLVNTWITNVSILKWYVERRK
ncbi:MAG TPA: protein translocase subunit SecF [Candidatus Nanoarchaeia archaeon]|nr:protein translocase subunit SecF [Candidatus Nanoarchaeia archaeon]